VEGCLTIEFKYNDICIEIDADHLENWLAGDGIDWGVKYEGEKVVREKVVREKVVREKVVREKVVREKVVREKVVRERSVAKQCGKRATISREEDSRELCGDEDFENQAEHIQCKTQSV
jgi:hypothetical protein